MPTQPTYPGVYIEEIPSGVRTITGVATSIAAFIGYFKRGPMNQAVQIFSMGDFEREFGGLDSLSEASYAIQQFFLNGGTQAHVVRVAAGTPVASNVTISSTVPAGAAVIRISAKNEGVWGDKIRIRIDHNTLTSGEFNMVVTEYDALGNIRAQESYLNLSMDDTLTNFVSRVVNDSNTGSSIIKIDETDTDAPASNGTLSGNHANPSVVAVLDANPAVDVTINGTTATAAFSTSETYPGNFTLNKLALLLENAIRSAAPTNKQFSGASVEVVGGRLHVMAGSGPPESVVSFANAGGGTTGDDLLLTAGASYNLQEYVLGHGNFANTAQMDNQDGDDEEGNNGTVPNGTVLIGSLNDKTGIYALEDVDLFNILCIPRTGMTSGPNAMTETEADSVISVAESYCESKRAFFILDTPLGIVDLPGIKNWIGARGNLRSKNAALYFPRVNIPDPLNNFRLRSVGACGTMAGLYARIDSNRGVWKAPAGTEASLRNVSSFTDKLTDSENGVLNPLGINCLRSFPVHGRICWGARTLEGADAMASEWKYIPVRRLALLLEESLFRGTKWVVFEPNDEPLWAQIRLNIGAFMNNLFKQGAFQGTSPKEAYLVKCDKETTTQNDINQGVVNILVGFAPLKPAEFVFIKIQQLAGQIET